MKREIKFRAYCSLLGTMIDEPYCYLSEDLRFQGYDLTNNAHQITAVMQFTGLRDKNGKEIYEGDVLNFDGVNLFTVEFQKGRFMGIAFPDNPIRGILETPYFHQSEVAGNIHQTPELLEPR